MKLPDYILAMWENGFPYNYSKLYYCAMNDEIIDAKVNEIILQDGTQFFYTVKSIEFTNVLGATIAVLDEYSIRNSAGEIYKLYKTKEGNWYDVPEANIEAEKAVLLSLKLAINSHLSLE